MVSWLDEHPEATTTVEDGSITAAKLNRYLFNTEDIQISGDTVQLANRGSSDGMGYVILRKNKTFAEQVTATNTIYEVRYDFDLNGKTITIPENCVLKFEGGSLRNGTLNGRDTKIENKGNCVIFDLKENGIIGTWIVPEIFSSWFYDLSYDNSLINVIALSNENIENTINIHKSQYDYIVSFSTANIGEWGLRLYSNTILTVDGIIRVRGNGKTGYRTIFGTKVDNITINGNGSIIGDYYEDGEVVPPSGKHDFTAEGTHEYCHGIVFYDSTNISIIGLSIGRFPGDSIVLSNTEDNIINNQRVNNCELYKSRRQGVSIIGNNIIIENNYIHNISGTAPESAIDIEPNNTTCTASNIVIENNVVESCKNGFEVAGHNGYIRNVKISNNKVSVVNYGIFLLGSNGEGLAPRGIEIENNIVNSESHGIYGVLVEQLILENNFINGTNYGLILNPGSLTKRINSVVIENNHISNTNKDTITFVILGDNISMLNNNISLDSEGSTKLGSVDGSNIQIIGNKFNNGWIEGTMTFAVLAANTFLFESVASIFPTFTLTNFSFNNNKYVLNPTENRSICLIRFIDCVAGTVENNELSLPEGLKVSQPLWIPDGNSRISVHRLVIKGNGSLYYNPFVIGSNNDRVSVDGAFKFGTYSNRPTTGLYQGLRYYATDKGPDSRGEAIIYTGDQTSPWIYDDGTPVT